MSAQLAVLERDIQKCRKQLASLQAAQEKACQEAADFREQFARCFPTAPSTLSYEVLEERTLPSLSFRFRVYEDLTNAVVLNSVQQYRDAATAERALFETLELTPCLGDYALMAPKIAPTSFS